MIVPRLLTPVPLVDLLPALDTAHRGESGYSLSDDAYRLAMAMLELEHGTAGGCLRGVWCFNFGNHDATHEDLADPSVAIFSTVPEHEGSLASTATAVHHRRAYPDLDAGLRGYWCALQVGFAEAYGVLETAPTPEGFAAALKRARYFTADESVYAAGLRRLLAGEPVEDPDPPTLPGSTPPPAL